MAHKRIAIPEETRAAEGAVEPVTGEPAATRIYYRSGERGKAVATQVTKKVPGHPAPEELNEPGWFTVIVVLAMPQ